MDHQSTIIPKQWEKCSEKPWICWIWNKFKKKCGRHVSPWHPTAKAGPGRVQLMARAVGLNAWSLGGSVDVQMMLWGSALYVLLFLYSVCIVCIVCVCVCTKDNSLGVHHSRTQTLSQNLLVRLWVFVRRVESWVSGSDDEIGAWNAPVSDKGCYRSILYEGMLSVNQLLFLTRIQLQEFFWYQDRSITDSQNQLVFPWLISFAAGHRLVWWS